MRAVAREAVAPTTNIHPKQDLHLPFLFLQFGLHSGLKGEEFSVQQIIQRASAAGDFVIVTGMVDGK